MTTRGDFVASIFMVIAIPGMTLFILRLCLHYIFQKATGRKDLSKIEKEQPIFCRILYLYPWKYIERYKIIFATVYKGNIIKNLILDCQSYTKYRPNETTGGIFVSWRRKEELPTGA